MSLTERPLDAAGHRRSPVTMPGYHQGRPPKNKGLRFPADPPPVEEIIAVMRATSNNADGARLRALIIVLWRAGLRISEALDLAETDLDRARGALTVRRGKGGRRREVGMDRWAWDQLTLYLEVRATLPVGALFCVIHGPTAGRRWEASASRKQLRRTAEAAGVRRRFAHHQLRHSHGARVASASAWMQASLRRHEITSDRCPCVTFGGRSEAARDDSATVGRGRSAVNQRRTAIRRQAPSAAPTLTMT